MIITLHGYTHPVNMMHAPVYINSNPVTMPQLSLTATTESHCHNRVSLPQPSLIATTGHGSGGGTGGGGGARGL